MSCRVLVVDYGIGNVFSVCNAVRRVGGTVELTADPASIRAAERVILPGVGAFARAMDALRARGLTAALEEFIGTGRPFMGICIGMQVLMERSSEFGMHEGLGMIPGEVTRIPGRGRNGERLRVPHIGWASLQRRGRPWTGTLLAPAESGDEAVYFVHSYHCKPAETDDLAAVADYGGVDVTAAIRRDNIVGVQFHPERSGEIGQKILRAFLDQ